MEGFSRQDRQDRNGLFLKNRPKRSQQGINEAMSMQKAVIMAIFILFPADRSKKGKSSSEKGKSSSKKGKSSSKKGKSSSEKGKSSSEKGKSSSEKGRMRRREVFKKGVAGGCNKRA